MVSSRCTTASAARTGAPTVLRAPTHEPSDRRGNSGARSGFPTFSGSGAAAPTNEVLSIAVGPTRYCRLEEFPPQDRSVWDGDHQPCDALDESQGSIEACNRPMALRRPAPPSVRPRWAPAV